MLGILTETGSEQEKILGDEFKFKAKTSVFLA